MNDYSATGQYYTIGHLTQFTGLTSRTIRSHLASGILKGEKLNGIWHFTAEQVESYIRHPAVRPSIQAKSHALVYDFLLNRKKSTPHACIILDLPDSDAQAVANHFCYAINNGPYSDLHFSFKHLDGTPRIILTGPIAQVNELVQSWQSSQQ